ncbi:hypothetical protein HNQ60_005190 [Povalibacter uvarum]|uniref:Cadherin-like beta-sandwich-like domain-containing protein n=1 Tax=Povalibacter uvarum TaxID=732238 RepID=A0A841HWH8_9GAMM|nr:hypothetical protein [Povalibacter uvarum]
MLLAIWALSFVLAGCGGSGGSSETPEPTSPAPPPPPAPPPETPPPEPPPAAADTNLSSLGLSIGELDQQFQPGVTNYTAKVRYLDNAVRIHAQASDPDAVVRVNGKAVTSGATERISLSEGQNEIDIVVENDTEEKNYSIELTRETWTTFEQSAYVKASNTGIDDVFGTQLALSGDTLVVGAPAEDSDARGVNQDGTNNAASGSGAAYVITRDSAGAWSQQAYLKASNGDTNDNFGYSVAIDGDVIAVGAPFEASNASGINGDQADNSATSAGAVYIFVRDSNGQWTQEAYLKPSTVASGQFGKSIALNGNTLVVAAPQQPMLIGTVYAFTRDADGIWSEQAVISASDPLGDAGFGQTLALEGDTLAVGAPWHPGISSFKGAVYVYSRQGSTWTEVVKLRGSNTEPSDEFGSSVALSDGTLAVGAPGEDSAAAGNPNDNSVTWAGAVYLFGINSAGTWEQTAFIKASDPGAFDNFGYAIALCGDWLAVSAENEAGGSTAIGGDESDNTKPGAGAAYLFVRDDSGNWSQELYVKASNSDAGDRFGRSSAALSDTTLVFGAPFEDSNATNVNGDSSNNTASASGAVYVFE